MPSRRTPVRWFKLLSPQGRRLPDLDWVTPEIGVSGTVHPRHLPGLAHLGIGAVVDLREEGKDDEVLLAQYGIRFLHLPVRDGQPPSQAQLDAGAGWVLMRLAEHSKVLIHCKWGIGRSVTLACCVLIQQGGDAAGAVRTARSRRWGATIGKRQTEALREFEQRARRSGPRPRPS